MSKSLENQSRRAFLGQSASRIGWCRFYALFIFVWWKE